MIFKKPLENSPYLYLAHHEDSDQTLDDLAYLASQYVVCQM